MATSNSWEMGNSDVDMNPDASGGADAIIAKMNQRLDMVSHLDTDTMQGGHTTARAETGECSAGERSRTRSASMSCQKIGLWY